MPSHIQLAAKPILADYLRVFGRLLDEEFLREFDRVLHVLCAAQETGATIYVAGNGGSAATASHWVNDLGKAAKTNGQAPMRVMSLTDNVSWLTALANDEGYDRVFSGQLENFAKPGDVLFVFSASGNSPNLLEAVSLARSRSVMTIGLLGFDGGLLKDTVDLCLWLPTEQGAYGIVESAHAVMCHVLTTCVAHQSEAFEANREKEGRPSRKVKEA